MQGLNHKIALYPGCSLEGSSSSYDISLDRVLEILRIRPEVLKDWNCCGATAAHALNRKLYLGLNLRNLALAEAQGFSEILAPCASCYHRLASVNFELQQDPELRAELNREAGLNYQGWVRVRNLLDLLARVQDEDGIAPHVRRPLAGLRVACYYGCLNTRIPRMECFDNRENPSSMERVVGALGAEPIDWSYKTECCGASLFISAEKVSAKLVARILQDAVARKADLIAVACPLCQNNLDTKQKEIREQFGIERPLPVLFITQLMGLAFGLGDHELGMRQNFVPFQRENRTAETRRRGE